MSATFGFGLQWKGVDMHTQYRIVALSVLWLSLAVLQGSSVQPDANGDVGGQYVALTGAGLDFEDGTSAGFAAAWGGAFAFPWM